MKKINLKNKEVNKQRLKIYEEKDDRIQYKKDY